MVEVINRIPLISVCLLLNHTLMTAAYSATCQEDLEAFGQKRAAAYHRIEKLTGGGKKKMDPVAACPLLKQIAKIEQDILDYIEQHKFDCQVPDEASNNIRQSLKRAQEFSGQACAVAQKMKDNTQTPKPQALPTGPLQSPDFLRDKK